MSFISLSSSLFSVFYQYLCLCMPMSVRGNRLSLPFGKDPRKFYKIGVDFFSETRGIKEWKRIMVFLYPFLT